MILGCTGKKLEINVQRTGEVTNGYWAKKSNNQTVKIKEGRFGDKVGIYLETKHLINRKIDIYVFDHDTPDPDDYLYAIKSVVPNKDNYYFETILQKDKYDSEMDNANELYFYVRRDIDKVPVIDEKLPKSKDDYLIAKRAPAIVQKIEYKVDGKDMQVIVYLDRKPDDYKDVEVKKSASDPQKFYIDIENATLKKESNIYGINKNGLTNVRSAQKDKGIVRVVCDVLENSKCDVSNKSITIEKVNYYCIIFKIKVKTVNPSGPVKPIEYSTAYVSSGFYRNDSPHELHGAIDIAGALPAGLSVKSIYSGIVTSKGWRSGYGNTITIKIIGGTYDGKYIMYAHLNSETSKSNGDTVKAGDVIGGVGDTGGDYPVHLHFCISSNAIVERENGININNLARSLYPGTNVRDEP